MRTFTSRIWSVGLVALVGLSMVLASTTGGAADRTLSDPTRRPSCDPGLLVEPPETVPSTTSNAAPPVDEAIAIHPLPLAPDDSPTVADTPIVTIQGGPGHVIPGEHETPIPQVSLVSRDDLVSQALSTHAGSLLARTRAVSVTLSYAQDTLITAVVGDANRAGIDILTVRHGYAGEHGYYTGQVSVADLANDHVGISEAVVASIGSAAVVAVQSPGAAQSGLLDDLQRRHTASVERPTVIAVSGLAEAPLDAASTTNSSSIAWYGPPDCTPPVIPPAIAFEIWSAQVASVAGVAASNTP